LWQAGRRPARRFARVAPLPPDVAAAIGTGRGPLPYALARRALEACGVRFCREAVVATADEAVAAAERLGYPVVVKADAAGLVHKSDVGGVRPDVRTAAEVTAACHALGRIAGVERFVVQERVGPGVELLVGARRDPVFGPVVAFGAGGLLTEAIRDVAVRLAPAAEGEAESMLDGGVRARLLAGPRGLPPVERSAVVDVIEAVGALIVDQPRIQAIDVNPLIAAGATVVAVDALVILG
ncbi:MAG: acetate--CoA ligase family protein, partial [Candidatus Rokuibacteriota bacterium]